MRSERIQLTERREQVLKQSAAGTSPDEQRVDEEEPGFTRRIVQRTEGVESDDTPIGALGDPHGETSQIFRHERELRAARVEELCVVAPVALRPNRQPA